MFWKSTGNDRVASSNSCNEQCTKVSSRSSTKVNPGLLRVFKGKAGCRDLISGVKGGKCLMKWYGSNATSHWSCCCAWKKKLLSNYHYQNSNKQILQYVKYIFSGTAARPIGSCIYSLLLHQTITGFDTWNKIKNPTLPLKTQSSPGLL